MPNKLAEKLQDFARTNKIIRVIRNFINNTILPFFLKLLAIIITLVLLVLVGLKVFKPDYLTKIYHKSSFYFLHYLNLDNQKYDEIVITGNKRVSQDKIIEVINSINITNFDENGQYQPLIQKMITELKTQLPWLNKVVITRLMPNKINVSVVEYEPFAIWQNGDKHYITDKDGNIILVEDLEEFKNLVILSGEGANKNISSLFNILAINPDLSSKVYSATWLGGRRWDIRLENGLLIKLPESEINQAWENLIKTYNIKGITNDLKIIDLRIKGKIYLEYGDSLIKEIKDL